MPLVTNGKSRHQAEALIGDAVAGIVAYARDVGKPIELEKLDFRIKKAVLEGESCKYSRMLSSLNYGKIRACFLLGKPGGKPNPAQAVRRVESRGVV